MSVKFPQMKFYIILMWSSRYHVSFVTVKLLKTLLCICYEFLFSMAGGFELFFFEQIFLGERNENSWERSQNPVCLSDYHLTEPFLIMHTVLSFFTPMKFAHDRCGIARRN